MLFVYNPTLQDLTVPSAWDVGVRMVLAIISAYAFFDPFF